VPAVIRWVARGGLVEAAEGGRRPASAQHVGKSWFQGEDLEVVHGFHVTLGDLAVVDDHSGL
jgi:hypothetical protein